MPFKSDAQRRFMYAKHPGIARRWTAEEKRKVRKSLIRLPNHRGVEWTPITQARLSDVRRSVKTAPKARAHAAVVRQGPRDVAAKEAYLAQVAQVKADRAAARKIGLVPRGSQAEQLESMQRSLGQRRSYEVRAQGHRNRQAASAERSYRKERQYEYDKVKMTPWQRKQIPRYMAASGVGAMYVNELAKSVVSDEDKATVAGGAAGWFAGQAGMTAGGYTAKKTLARRRKDALIADPEYRKTYKREWDKFRHKYGFRTLKDEGISGMRRTAIMRHYPKTLKDWKGERALAWKNTPVVAVPLVGSVVAAGALGARKHVANQDKVGKSLVTVNQTARVNVAEGRVMPVQWAAGTYPYLNMRVAEAAPGSQVRTNPISPLQMLSASNMIADGYRLVRTINPLHRTGRMRAGMHQMTMGAQMAYQPLGVGRYGA